MSNSTRFGVGTYGQGQAWCEEGDFTYFVGLDVHKETISAGIARRGRGDAEYLGEFRHTKKAVGRLLERVARDYGDGDVLFCYEAGPCGYGIYRELGGLGHACMVVAPSQIPRKAGDRIKTDRRDALNLARLLRSGDLTAVWVPCEEQEAMRDLVRARSDMKGQEQKARQQLNAFVLRHGHRWPRGKSRWTKAHFNWLESLVFAHPWQHVVLQEYIDAVRGARQRVTDLTDQVLGASLRWSLAPVIDSLIALRGIDKLAAITLLAELGDISRFASPRELMAYLGLVPREHSSGPRRRRGSITKAGNAHARRILVESAWSYRFPARQTMHLKRKAKHASPEAKAIAWRAQKRLCRRYRSLLLGGKKQQVVTVAIARELVGFIWDIARHEMPTVRPVACSFGGA